jgi:hypothetical protein
MGYVGLALPFVEIRLGEPGISCLIAVDTGLLP